MSHDGKQKVSLEDLLRMKRAETPPPEFWVRFDEQLRAKQLAALVQRRAWWRRIIDGSSLGSALRSIGVPVGATAVLVLSMMTVGDSRQPQESLRIPDAAAPLVLRPEEVAVARAVKGLRQDDVAVVVIATAAVVVEQGKDGAAELSSTQKMSEPIDRAGGVGWAGLPPHSLLASDPSLSTRSIAANLMVTGEVEPELLRNLVGAPRGLEISGTAMRSAVDPLQQMTPPSEVRLARYRSPLVASISGDGGDRTGERAARRLSDERLYDQINRFGARGDRLQVRF